MLRFGIRDVLWTTAITGLGLALWMARSEASSLRNERDTLQQAITNSGFVVQGCWSGPTLYREEPEQP
jgi:hypothetical protein